MNRERRQMFERELFEILKRFRLDCVDHCPDMEKVIDEIKTLIAGEIEALPVLICDTSKVPNIIEWSHAVVKRDLKSRFGIAELKEKGA